MTISSGRILIILAALLWSTSALFVKSPAFGDWAPESRGVALAFWRAMFAGLLLTLCVRRIRWDKRLLLSGALFAAMNASYLSAMVFVEASQAIWLQYTAPFWVLAGSWLLLRERPPRSHLASWLVLAIGVGLVLSTCDWLTSPLGIGLGLTSGLCFAGIVLTLRWMRDLDSAWIILVNHAVTALVLAPFVWQAGVFPNATQGTMLALFGMLQMGLPYVLFAIAIRAVPSAQASALLLLEPLFLPLWVWFAYRHLPNYQPPHWGTLAGGALIVIGLLLQLCQRVDHAARQG